MITLILSQKGLYSLKTCFKLCRYKLVGKIIHNKLLCLRKGLVYSFTAYGVTYTENSHQMLKLHWTVDRMHCWERHCWLWSSQQVGQVHCTQHQNNCVQYNLKVAGYQPLQQLHYLQMALVSDCVTSLLSSTWLSDQKTKPKQNQLHSSFIKSQWTPQATAHQTIKNKKEIGK